MPTIISEVDLVVPPAEERATRTAKPRIKNPWVAFIVRRVVSLVWVFLALAVIVFGLVRLAPGDPAVAYAGDAATAAQVEQAREELGLTGSLREQFWHYVNDLAHGDLGTSFTHSVPVSELIAQRVGVSAELAFGALVLVLSIGIPVGLLAGAVTQGGRARRFEGGFSAVTSLLYAIPEFFTAILLVFVFAIQLGLFPASGVDGFSTLILPLAAVSLGPIALLSRVVRLETVNVLSQDYVRMARSQRLRPRTVYLRHVLPNVLTASMTIAGLIFASIIGGAVVIESVFNRPGLGTALVEAVKRSDYPTSSGIILVLGVTVVLVNLVVDLVIATADPRSLAQQS